MPNYFPENNTAKPSDSLERSMAKVVSAMPTVLDYMFGTFYRDFAKRKTLNHGIGPNITFTRGSQATYFDASGTLRFAPHNANRNSRAGGSTNGVIGSDGVLPTNWTGLATNGIATEVVGTGTENGIAYIDLKYSGTPTASGSFYPTPEAANFISASSGQVWTFSAYVKVAAGSTANTVIKVYCSERGSGGGDLANTGATITPTTASLASQRASVTRTFNNSSTNFALGFLGVDYTSGQAINITLRIAAPQLERNATASDYIPTTGTANFDQPRFDHDPATGASRGLLIEEARQNLFQRSAEFDNAYWIKTSTTVTADNAVAPDGTTTADLTEKTGNDATTPARVVSVAASAYTLSAFFKNNTGGRARLRIDATSGTVVDAVFDIVAGTVVSASAGLTTSIVNAGSGWFRCAITYTFSGAVNATFGISARNTSADNTGAKAWIWGAQLEQGAFPTSYIPTTSAAVTRSADSAVVTPISGFYNQSEGTLFAEAIAGTASGTASGIHQQTVVQLLENNVGDILAAIYRPNGTTNGSFFVGTAGGTQANLAQAGFTAGANTRLAAAYKTDDFALSVNGTAAATDTSGSLPTATTLRIGRYGTASGYLNGHIRRIAYYPRRLSNALLEQLTT